MRRGRDRRDRQGGKRRKEEKHHILFARLTHVLLIGDKFPTNLRELNQLQYCEQIVKETLRIVPPPGKT